MVAALTWGQMHCHTLVSFIVMIRLVEAVMETGRRAAAESNISEAGNVRRASLMFSIKVAGMR